MPKAIICIKECGLNPVNNSARLVYDLSTNYLDPNAGVPLTIGDQTMDVIITNSIFQINAGIKSAAISNLTAQGFPNSGITSQDIIIFGGAQ